MPLPIFTATNYADALVRLLPRGFAWPRDPASTQYKTALGLARCLGQLNTDANGVVVDAFPATAVHLLAEWESTLGLVGTGTTSQRQTAIITALASQGGSSVAYFQGLVLTFGFRACTILQYKPSTVTSGVGQPLVGIANAFRWTVTAYGNPGAGHAGAMETALLRYRPAHTTVDFIFLP